MEMAVHRVTFNTCRHTQVPAHGANGQTSTFGRVHIGLPSQNPRNCVAKSEKY